MRWLPLSLCVLVAGCGGSAIDVSVTHPSKPSPPPAHPKHKVESQADKLRSHHVIEVVKGPYYDMVRVEDGNKPTLHDIMNACHAIGETIYQDQDTEGGYKYVVESDQDFADVYCH